MLKNWGDTKRSLKIDVKYAAKLTFYSTNNVAKYEALLAGLRLAIEVKP